MGILIFIYKYLESIRYSWLLKFERKIIVEGLTSEDIKTYFIKEYLGEYLLDWLKSVDDEIDKKLRAFKDFIDEYNKKYLDFEINEDLIVKDSASFKDTITLIKINVDSYEKGEHMQADILDFIKIKQMHLKDFITKGTFSEKELILLKSIIYKFDEKIKYLDEVFKDSFEKAKKDNTNVRKLMKIRNLK